MADDATTTEQRQRARTQALLAARWAERYSRHQAEVTSGRRRQERTQRIGVPDEGGTRFIEPSQQRKLRKIAQLVRLQRGLIP
jgi:hypothetical protein